MPEGNIGYTKAHGEQEANHQNTHCWLHLVWLTLIDLYLLSGIFSVDEIALHYRAMPEHNYHFNNDKINGFKGARITSLCCAVLV